MSDRRTLRSDRRTRRGAAARVLDVAAAFGACCLLALAATLLVGFRPLIVAGSSMEPGVPLGSLALAVETPVAELQPGDVVSVVRDDGGRVTHRLIAIDPVDLGGTAVGGTGLAELTLQGDANRIPDATRPVESSVDRVVWTVPGVGRLLVALRSPAAMFLVGALTGWAIWSVGTARVRRSRAVMWIDDVPYQVQPWA